MSDSLKQLVWQCNIGSNTNSASCTKCGIRSITRDSFYCGYTLPLPGGYQLLQGSLTPSCHICAEIDETDEAKTPDEAIVLHESIGQLNREFEIMSGYNNSVELSIIDLDQFLPTARDEREDLVNRLLSMYRKLKPYHLHIYSIKNKHSYNMFCKFFLKERNKYATEYRRLTELLRGYSARVLPPWIQSGV